MTISEVAAAAGVSRQTVSNVLKAPERVAADTAARVRRAIDDLGYRPNRAAQNLRQRASRCIGLKMVSPPGVSNLLDRFLHALTEAAGAAGYHILLFAAVDEELGTYEDLIRTGTVDGFVLFDVEVGDPRPPWFARRGIPFVCFGRPRGQRHERFRWVDVDGAYGVARAVDHLVSLGHRRIAYLGWPEGTGFGDERRAGWAEAARRHGLDVGHLTATSAETVTAAASAAARLLSRPEPPTAFACGSDTFAIGARLAGGTGASGRPNVEVVGFDDSAAATLMSPPMSSVRQPLDEVARCVVAALIDQLGGVDDVAEGVMLRPELVTREWRGPEPVH
ncbi:LacI family DNA-binding transcriptional regulator [Actinoallomurus bryophytorum]|uniref:LacI family transcriptional regulator n=1 Tax=Actinoallomurus bryophytorum TaxID=1490222 RepID=A0A543CWJ3_9ACTN|nr:LacI family DNA-binding transcriptional regulator [Actinoallomurus bryophytorum]TQM01470.1 LacI family transcriptional regulator [Actinoallomurus bryophytorum]